MAHRKNRLILAGSATLALMLAGTGCLTAASPAPVAAQDPVARGQYLAIAADCEACHTAPGGKPFAGGYAINSPMGTIYAGNITPSQSHGIGGWSDTDLTAYLQNGHAKDKAVAAGPMGEAVTHSLSRLTDADRMAIVRYLRSVPAIAVTGEDKPACSYGRPVKAAYDFDQSDARETLDAARQARARDMAVTARRSDAAGVSSGAVLYGAACASCHQPTGSGTGADGHIAMPAFKADMTDAQVAAVANFVAQHFGNPAMQVNAATVAKLRAGETRSWLAELGPWLAGLPVLAIAFLAFRVWRGRRKPIPFTR